jgi:predicted lipoprotein with Yx(FWY)xxD motif
MKTATRASTLVATLLGVALVASACSSSKTTSSGGSAPAGGGASSGGSGGMVTVETHSGPMGTYLTDGAGRSLYMFAADSATKSACAGACLTYWPPLTASGGVHASGGVSSSKLTTLSGSKQVVYAGHPLYYYKQDTAPGDTSGQGSTNFGAKWWLLAPSGAPITSTGGGSSSSSSSSGGGGGGGWS